MGAMIRPGLLVGLACAVLGLSSAVARKPETAALSDSVEEKIAIDCSTWTLDGYRLGMRGDEVLAVRSVTIHVEGQAQAIEPGRFNGVLVFDALNTVKKWDVTYHTTDGTALRAEMRERFGEPTSDVSGNILDNESETVHQRRTIWWSGACDAAIVIYESTSVRGTPVHSVSATLARASSFKQGVAEMKPLSH
jgi:hypothetical protein